MDIIAVLRENEDAASMLYDICDVDILPEYRSPQDEDGHVEYNIPGKTFAKDGSGGEYILLEDGSVGYWGSEGECGRIADSVDLFFEFMLNCPFWMDYRNREPYEQGGDALRVFSQELTEEHSEMAADDLDLILREVQQSLAGILEIPLCDDTLEQVLMKFYHSANRSPRLITTFTENDGSKLCPSRFRRQQKA